MKKNHALALYYLWGTRLDGLDQFILNSLPSEVKRVGMGQKWNGETPALLHRYIGLGKYGSPHRISAPALQAHSQKILTEQKQFTHTIILSKHPITWVTEWLLLSVCYQPALGKKEAYFQKALKLFETRDTHPSDLGFIDLVSQVAGISLPQMKKFLQVAVGDHLTLLSQIIEKSSDALTLKFEDFENHNFKALNTYLNINLKKNAKNIPAAFRQWPQSLNWQTWLSADDQTFLNELCQPFRARLGYTHTSPPSSAKTNPIDVHKGSKLFKRLATRAMAH